jgi:hypothetical protein
MGCENEGIAVIKLIMPNAVVTRVVDFMFDYRLIKVNAETIVGNEKITNNPKLPNKK